MKITLDARILQRRHPIQDESNAPEFFFSAIQKDILIRGLLLTIKNINKGEISGFQTLCSHLKKMQSKITPDNLEKTEEKKQDDQAFLNTFRILLTNSVFTLFSLLVSQEQSNEESSSSAAFITHALFSNRVNFQQENLNQILFYQDDRALIKKICVGFVNLAQHYPETTPFSLHNYYLGLVMAAAQKCHIDPLITLDIITENQIESHIAYAFFTVFSYTQFETKERVKKIDAIMQATNSTLLTPMAYALIWSPLHRFLQNPCLWEEQKNALTTLLTDIAATLPGLTICEQKVNHFVETCYIDDTGLQASAIKDRSISCYEFAYHLCRYLPPVYSLKEFNTQLNSIALDEHHFMNIELHLSDYMKQEEFSQAIFVIYNKSLSLAAKAQPVTTSAPSSTGEGPSGTHDSEIFDFDAEEITNTPQSFTL